MADITRSIRTALELYSALLAVCVFPLLLVVEPFLGFWADWLMATGISITSLTVMFRAQEPPRRIKELLIHGAGGIALLTVNGFISSALASYILMPEKNLETAIKLGAYLAHAGSVFLLYGLFFARLVHALKKEMRVRTSGLLRVQDSRAPGLPMQVIAHSARGIYKRLDELGELELFLREELAGSVQEKPWVFNWIQAQRFWMTDLIEKLEESSPEFKEYSRRQKTKYD